MIWMRNADSPPHVAFAEDEGEECAIPEEGERHGSQLSALEDVANNAGDGKSSDPRSRTASTSIGAIEDVANDLPLVTNHANDLREVVAARLASAPQPENRVARPSANDGRITTAVNLDRSQTAGSWGSLGSARTSTSTPRPLRISTWAPRPIQRISQVSATGRHQIVGALFQTILENGADPRDDFSFFFKNRPFAGRAIHVVALQVHPEAAMLARSLLSMHADMNEPARSDETPCRCARPLHFAASQGNVDVLEVLWEFGVDINQEATRDEKFHYLALHDAAYGGMPGTVKWLLDHQAELNSTNSTAQTAMHLSAMQGHAEVVQMLVANEEADKHVPDAQGKTALILAVNGERFPPSKLHLLSTHTIDDVLAVAELAPVTAFEMMEDSAENSPVSEKWRKGIDKVSADQWVRLMHLSPRAAENVLEAVTITPPVIDNFRHSLPRSAYMVRTYDKYTVYTGSSVWDYDSVHERYPVWHDQLAPPSASQGWLRSHKVSIEVKMLNVSNFTCHRVLDTLANTEYKHIFANLATQALLDYLWEFLVMPARLLRMFRRLCDIGSAAVAVTKSERPVFFPEKLDFAPFLWSAIFAGLIQDIIEGVFAFIVVEPRGERDKSSFLRMGSMTHSMSLVAKLPSVAGHRFRLRQTPSVGHLPKMASLFVAGCLCFFSSHDYRLQDQPELLAAFCCARWLQFLFSLRGFAAIGLRLGPILMSFKAMGAISFVAMVSTIACYHTLLAVGAQFQEWSVTEVAVYRLLFAGDFDGFDFSTDVNSSPYFVCVIIVMSFCFNVCLLNLFIAVHGEAYEKYLDLATATFYQQRAIEAADFYCFPSWRKRLGIIRHRYVAAACLLIFGLGIWTVLIAFFTHPALAATIFALISCLCQSIILQQPWLAGCPPADRSFGHSVGAARCSTQDAEHEEGYFLWICRRNNWSESAQACGTRSHAGEEGRGRAKRLHASLQHHAHSTSRKIEDLHDQLQSRFEEMNERNEIIDRRFDKVCMAVDRIEMALEMLTPHLENEETTGSRLAL